ncbi:hypothetical protein V5O48_012837 [Marasmius crinis-equi]|uniref:Uncharacterized protein n=1 Tax=Marasmius crinis-equi TaxID=585013 RepID=A0ABR3F1S6_9AGAR
MASTSSSLDANGTVNAFLTEIEAPLRTFVSQGSFRKWRCDELVRSKIVSPQVLDHINNLQTRIPACFDSAQAERPNFLLEGLEDAIDDEPRFARFCSLFKAGEHSILLNTSGSGKTRTCFEALTQLWGLYFVCHTGDKIGSNDLKSAMGLLDAKGNGFTTVISSPARKPITTRARNLLLKNRSIAGSLFSSVLLARLLILKLFLELTQEDKPKDVPIQTYMRRWLVLQLQPTVPELPHIPDLFYALFLKIRTSGLSGDEVEDGIHSTMRAILSAISSLQVGSRAKDQKSLFIIIDEAQEASCLHPKAFRCSNFERSNERPALRELVHVWRRVCNDMRRGVSDQEMVTIIVTGTGLRTEEIEEALTSTTMKPTKVAEINIIGAFEDRGVQEQYVRKYIPESILSHVVGQVLLDRIWHWLRGRYRFTAAYLALLIEHGFQQPNEVLNQFILSFAEFQPSDCPQDILDLEKDLWPLQNAQPRNSYGQPDWGRLEQLKMDELLEVVKCCYVYLLTTEIHPPLGTSDQKLLQFGFARIPEYTTRQDINKKKPVMDEKLILCASAVWFNNKKGFTLFRWISQNINYTAADGRNFFEFFLAFYFTLAFGGGARKQRVGNVFNLFEILPGGSHMVSLENRSATLVSIYSPKGGPANRECTVQFGPNADILAMPGPIGFRTGNNSGRQLLTWLDHQGREAVCFPDMAMGPDLLFLLRLEEPVEYLWVAVQSKLRNGFYSGNKNVLPPARIMDAIKSVTPSTFFGRIRCPPEGTNLTDTESLPLLNECVCGRLKNLERREMNTAGECSLLRVVASWPAVTEFERCLGKVPPGSSDMGLEQAYEFSFQNDDPDQVGDQYHRWHPLATLNIDTLLDLTKHLKPTNILENYQLHLETINASNAQLKKDNRSSSSDATKKGPTEKKRATVTRRTNPKAVVPEAGGTATKGKQSTASKRSARTKSNAPTPEDIKRVDTTGLRRSSRIAKGKAS